MLIPQAIVQEGGAGGLFSAYALIREEQTSGTNGGVFNSGAWRTRTLNTESFDPDGIVSISSNQFTLAAGTYYIEAKAPAFQVNQHKAKLADITNAADTLIGTSEYSGASSNIQSSSWVRGRFTIAGSTVFEIQHQCAQSKATDGLGVQSGFSVAEVYTEVAIWKES